MPNTYFVRKTGSDGAAGTSAGAAWLTVDKAANSVAAGDTVYIGAGVYRELVTMDTSGSSGSQITYIGDVTGENTGDAGIVLISAYLDESQRSVGALAACWNMNGKEFITLRGLTMEGDKGIYDNDLAGNRAYEGVIIEHRLIMIKHLGRPLKSNEHVHHIDGNPGNNSIDNLIVLTHSEHARLHKATREIDKFGRFT